MLKRVLALAICLSLVLTGCSFGGSVIGSSSTKRVINIALSRELTAIKDIVIDGMVRPLKSISNGYFEINFRITDNPLESLDQGDNIVIMSTTEASLGNSDYAIYASPFYFRDYEHYSITLGHEEFIELTGERDLSLFGARPFGALYAGGYTLFSGKDEPVGEIEGFKDNRVGILPTSTFLEIVLEEIGAKVQVRGQEELIASFGAKNIPIIELPNRFADSLEKPEKIERVYYAETPHRLDTNWVMVSEGTIDTFSDWEIALIKEAVASLIAYNDNSILEQERQAFLALGGKFQIVSEPVSYADFSNVVESVLRRSYRYNNLWNWEIYSKIKEIC